MTGYSVRSQRSHALKLLSSHFPQFSVDSLHERLEFMKSIGCPQTSVVYEGLYGIGFQIVKYLCLFGVEKILVLSRFPLSNDSRKRFHELEGFVDQQ
jgi:hypothetical protein